MSENTVIGKTTRSYRGLFNYVFGSDVDAISVQDEIRKELKEKFPGISWDYYTREITLENGYDISSLDLLFIEKDVDRFLAKAIPEIVGKYLFLYGVERKDSCNAVVPLRFFRIKKGMSQKKLSEDSSVNIRQIQKIENGEINILNVTLKNALALADALDISVNELAISPIVGVDGPDSKLFCQALNQLEMERCNIEEDEKPHSWSLDELRKRGYLPQNEDDAMVPRQILLDSMANTTK